MQNLALGVFCRCIFLLWGNFLTLKLSFVKRRLGFDLINRYTSDHLIYAPQSEFSQALREGWPNFIWNKTWSVYSTCTPRTPMPTSGRNSQASEDKNAASPLAAKKSNLLQIQSWTVYFVKSTAPKQILILSETPRQ